MHRLFRFGPGFCRRSVTLALACICLATATGATGLFDTSAAAQAPPPAPSAAARRPVIELYYDAQQPAHTAALRALETWESEHPDVIVVRRDVNTAANLTRQQAIAKHYQVGENELPLGYGGNRVAVWRDNSPKFLAGCQQMLQIEVFVRSGCQHCEAAERYLATYVSRYPGWQIRYRQLGREAAAATDLNRLVRQHRTAAASVPVFHMCNQLVVGFDRPETTGQRLEQILMSWTAAAPQPSRPDADSGCLIPAGRTTQPILLGAALQLVNPSVALIGLANLPQPAQESVPDLPLPGLEPPALPAPPAEADGLPLPSANDASSSIQTPQFVVLPWIGRVNVRDLGLPLFTLAVGLVDGFNPCAMWVLLFLLSLLVNLHSRSRILAVAGTFVIVSGVAYYAFMAAWLNVFLLIGLLRPVQILLGVIGITVGSIHVKDFFAFKQGISLSIPESAKPGIYARARAIITAENLGGALVAAVTLAVLVNVVELLCTAGLPALYTQILVGYELPAWRNHAYLALYILAYMLDDSLMVAIVVITLSRQKMQEQHGRWLKLISGIVIIVLGLVVLFQPDWLQ